MTELYARVYGRVQMVMFRDFVCRNARSRNVVGSVRNLPDGSVEVVAQGAKNDLETFILLLKKGPLLAKVERVEVAWRNPTEQFETFHIFR